MPVRIACPNCKSSLSMPESMYGRQVKCPKCQHPFQCPSGPEQKANVPPPPPPVSSGNPLDFGAGQPAYGTAPDALDFGAHEPGGVIAPRGGWGRVGSGVTFLCISAAGFLLFYLVFYFMGHAKERPTPGVLKTVFTLLALVYISSCVLGSIGLLRCASVPNNPGARGAAYAGSSSMAIASVCTTTVILPRLIQMFTEKPLLGEGAGPFMFYVFLTALGTLVAGFVFCIFFLTIVACHVKSHALLSSVVSYGVFLMVSPFIFVGIIFLAAMFDLSPVSRGGGFGGGPMSSKGPDIMGTLSLILIISWVVWFIANLLLVNPAVARARRMGRI